jgi:chromosomal replication initiation ATPase DnaA
MLTRCRKRENIKAKHIAMFCLKKFTDMNFRQIGEIFNGEGTGKHADVYHAIKSVNNQTDVYPAYRMELNNIINALKTNCDIEYNKYNQYNTDNV